MAVAKAAAAQTTKAAFVICHLSIWEEKGIERTVCFFSHSLVVNTKPISIKLLFIYIYVLYTNG